MDMFTRTRSSRGLSGDNMGCLIPTMVLLPLSSDYGSLHSKGSYTKEATIIHAPVIFMNPQDILGTVKLWRI